MSRFFLLLVILFYLFVSVCFSKSVKSIFPENLDRSHSCASDGMVIIDYKGPKAQILWKNGNRTFYCEVREAFFEKFDVIKKKQIIAVFVQDFSFLEWGSYKDKWILADDAFYVIYYHCYIFKNITTTMIIYHPYNNTAVNVLWWLHRYCFDI